MSDEAISDDTLRAIPLFRQMNETELHQIKEIFYVKSFPAGELIVKQGERSRILWVLLKGQCEVIKEAGEVGPRGDVVLDTLEPYAHFGEMSFFGTSPHLANIKAKTAINVICIPHAEFNDLVQDGVSAAYKIAYNVVDSLADRLRRMDQWVADLLSDQESSQNASTEWSTFRQKVFKEWN